MARQAYGFERQPETLGDAEVNDAERDRQARAAGQYLVEEAVTWVRVVLDVAVKTPFVEQHAVYHAALLADGGRLDDQLATPGGELVELRAACPSVERRREGAGEQQRA
jgi:hypothetical protein